MLGKNRYLLLVLSAGMVIFLLTGILMGRVLAREGNLYSYLKLFNEALHLIENNYVESVGTDRLLEGAYQGLFEGLDPMSEFLTRADYREVLESGTIPGTGIGLALSRVRGYLSVVSVWPGSPAAEAELATGDQVLRIADHSTRGLSLVAAARHLRGEPGTLVRLLVMRARWSAPKEISITRSAPPPSWSARVLPRNIGYIRLLDFPEDSTAHLEASLGEFRESGIRNLILDLRNNAGVGFPTALEVARLFMQPGPVAWLKGKNETRVLWAEQDGQPVWSDPLLVLVNRGTAAGGELIAAALQASGRSSLMGESTYGLGTRSTLYPLPDGSAVRLSTDRILPPEGEGWHKEGLEPDWTVGEDLGDDDFLSEATDILLNGKRKKDDHEKEAA